MIDVAKIADLVLLVVDAHFGFEMVKDVMCWLMLTMFFSPGNV